MRIGIIDILSLPSNNVVDRLYRLLLTKQFASITPQAISVWCRRMGHETFYATYYGSGAPHRLLPSDLDVVFVASYTQVSPIAYALGVLYRQAGVRTVIGGPHAKAFPVDCLRFFDLVVKDCDENLIADILSGQFDPGSIISSAQPFDDVPTVEERMPEIRKASYYFGKQPLLLSNIPLLASIGCPYQCNFCIDWSSSYRVLSMDRLAADMRYIGEHMPNRVVSFHDPNFAVKFDQVFEVLEAQPPDQRPPYVFESSLTVLRGDRVQRLKETNCVLVAPGVESWSDYSDKAGVGRTGGIDKVNRVADHFQRLHESVPYLQANFMFGLDTDSGDGPIELTKLFLDKTPFAWPAINIPIPLGGTPLYDEHLRDGRILQAMPFGFYYAPYLVTTIRNYDPVTYYEKLIELHVHASSPAMLRRRIDSTTHGTVKLVHRARTHGMRGQIRRYQRILDMLRSDAQFRAFHEGRSTELPEFYHQEFERTVGPYAELLSRADRTPNVAHGVAPDQPQRAPDQPHRHQPKLLQPQLTKRPAVSQ